MTVIRKTSTGKAFHVITDEGIVYSGSVVALKILLDKGNTFGKDFLLLSRLPNSVSPDRFPKSKVWLPDGLEAKDSTDDRASQDAYSAKTRKEVIQTKEDKQVYEDKIIW